MTVPGLPNTEVKTGTPYDTAAPFVVGATPVWAPSQFDKIRLASYDLYDAIYRNVTGTFKLVARGTENNPVYIPSGKTIVETCNRFLAVEFDYAVEGATQADRDAATAALDAVFRRNKFWSKFTTQKRYGLVRGDAMWHVVADPRIKDVTKRIQLLELDPRTYFPITDVHNINIILGCYVILRMADPVDRSRRIIKRQCYMFNNDGTVQSSMNYFDERQWDDRTNPETLLPYHLDVYPLAPVHREVLVNTLDANGNVTYGPDGALIQHTEVINVRGDEPFNFTLDERITYLPVFHIKNMRAPNDPFGVSEMSGIERVISSVNQAISDEELALALDGLGMYATTSGPPTDDQGNPTNWVLGPGRVVEIDEAAEFKRVNGVISVDAPQKHLDWLVKSMRENTATSDAAIGISVNSRDVSGIALALQLAPLLAKNAEKETEMLDEYDHMFNSLLNEWFPAYGIYNPPEGLIVSPIVGDPMPVDRAAIITEVTGLVAENIITILEAQSILKEKLGYEFHFSTLEDFMAQGKALSATRDPFAARLNDEQAAIDSGDQANQGATAQPPTKIAPAA